MALRTSSERPEKILVAMLALGGGGTRFLDYDDIVVKAFEMFPSDFCLRKHPRFPDSSDIHKPLYGPLKRKGLVRSANKAFALTPLGVERANRLVNAAGKALNERRPAARLMRTEEVELDRMLHSDACGLAQKGLSEQILDTDFFTFLGCTVRTPRNEFHGRLSICKDIIDKARLLARPTTAAAEALLDVMQFMEKKFDNLINYKGSKNV